MRRTEEAVVNVGGNKGFVALTLGTSLLVAGCNAQNANEAGGAIGSLLGAVAGAAIGGNNDIGPLGGALLGDVTEREISRLAIALSRSDAAFESW